MAGINRLGKAPPRPGSLRPPDPNRNRVLDIYSEGTEGDADYMRMVQDIEDAQQSQVGWLFGRGAFDKGDLLYLRDEEEKRRFKEEELQESERAMFSRLQAVAGPGPDRPPAAPAPPPPRAVHNQPPRSQAKLLANLVKVKGNKGAPPAKREAEGEAAPAAKRSKPVEESEKDDGAGLAGLLGDYGSEDEGDSGSSQEGSQKGDLAAHREDQPAADKTEGLRASHLALGPERTSDAEVRRTLEES